MISVTMFCCFCISNHLASRKPFRCARKRGSSRQLTLPSYVQVTLSICSPFLTSPIQHQTGKLIPMPTVSKREVHFLSNVIVHPDHAGSLSPPYSRGQQHCFPAEEAPAIAWQISVVELPLRGNILLYGTLQRPMPAIEGS